ncbi:MAG: hypothetical protein KAS32_05455, partial [Candidatus Peribacteraceae bacterium]|nr:hypothetical protein [Candidatus Peribacteraceae bacterium]
FIVTDIELGKGRLVPIPTSGDTVELMTHRLPEEKIEDDDVDPVIDPQYHLDMLIWAKKLAYEKHDSETLDKKESVDFEMQWERRVAEINKRNKIKISGAGVVQYGGF